jgi:chromosomal replication initiator protein
METVSEYYDVSLKAIKGKNRSRKNVLARHVAFYLMRQNTKLTLIEIGVILGNRDHTTVIHGVKMVNNYITHPYDDTIKKDVFNLNILI